MTTCHSCRWAFQKWAQKTPTSFPTIHLRCWPDGDQEDEQVAEIPCQKYQREPGTDESNVGLEGMTLLDYFAARALPAVAAIPDAEWPFDFSDARGDETCYADHMAMAAYAVAKAMMRAREHQFFAPSNA